MKKLIGYALLARLRSLCAVGRVAYRIALRYGQVGSLGSYLTVVQYEADLRKRYGLPDIRQNAAVR